MNADGSAPIRLLLVEDHDLLADSLDLALSSDGFEVRRPTGVSYEEILREASGSSPHVVLLDLHLGDESALPLIGPLRDGGASVLVVSSERSQRVLAECVEAGAVGFVGKSEPFEELLRAVRHVADVRTLLTKDQRDELLAMLRAHRLEEDRRLAPFERLTDREQQVLTHLVEGRTARDIAATEYVSIATVRSHIRNVLSKLGVSSQVQAVALARSARWPSSGG